MTLPELVQLLKTIKRVVNGVEEPIPIAYSHFTQTTENPMPSPPFICYLDQDSDNFSADNKTYHEVENVDIELYFKKKDLALEKQIKNLLIENELPYEKTPSIWIESEGVFQCVFSITLI
ncbi:hypothetical protein MTP04_22420 [Lysinibacillus sp. PLM2]|nr:hypothetical protein MTP04_22420 [Lysinibacillus sp. PLM2]